MIEFILNALLWIATIIVGGITIILTLTAVVIIGILIQAACDIFKGD